MNITATLRFADAGSAVIAAYPVPDVSRSSFPIPYAAVKATLIVTRGTEVISETNRQFLPTDHTMVVGPVVRAAKLNERFWRPVPGSQVSPTTD